MTHSMIKCPPFHNAQKQNSFEKHHASSASTKRGNTSIKFAVSLTNSRVNMLVCTSRVCILYAYYQACVLKFKLRELPSCLCSAAAWAVCFEGSVAGVNATETGNEVSQPTLEFTSLHIMNMSWIRNRVRNWVVRFVKIC